MMHENRRAAPDSRLREMIQNQLRARGIDHPRILEAFRSVDRTAFVPEHLQHRAYEDNPLPIGGGQTISQPYIVALTLQELDPRPGDTVLDVGSGSGYQTALLARLAGTVHAVERLESLADEARRRLEQQGITNVVVHVGDGTEALPDFAPFDRIVCGAAAPEIPPAWVEQLAEAGRIVTPVGGRAVQTLVRVEKRNGELTRTELCGVRFVPLIGRQGWKE